MLPLKSIGYLFRPPARPPAQAFTDSIQGDWGGGPMEDIKAGVRALLAAHPFLDADRVGALGASYGGYMVNMLNGNNEDGMFKVRQCVCVCVCVSI